MKPARHDSIEQPDNPVAGEVDDLFELRRIETRMNSIGRRLHATRDPRLRTRMASDLDALKRRIDAFIGRQPSGISDHQYQYLRSAAEEISFTVVILRAPSSVGHA